MKQNFNELWYVQGSKQEDAAGRPEYYAHMLSAREDAELQQKANAEIQDVPNTIPAFK